MYQNQNLYNPYLQQMYQPQNQSQYPYQNMMQPQVGNLTLNGKVINRLEDISVNDVPMDGNVAIFPMADRSKIFVKSWNSNGTISTMEFEPKNEPKKVEPNNSTLTIEKAEFDDFKQLLTSIEDKVNKLSSPRTRKKESETVDD